MKKIINVIAKILIPVFLLLILGFTGTCEHGGSIEIYVLEIVITFIAMTIDKKIIDLTE